MIFQDYEELELGKISKLRPSWSTKCKYDTNNSYAMWVEEVRRLKDRFCIMHPNRFHFNFTFGALVVSTVSSQSIRG